MRFPLDIGTVCPGYRSDLTHSPFVYHHNTLWVLMIDQRSSLRTVRVIVSDLLLHDILLLFLFGMPAAPSLFFLLKAANMISSSANHHYSFSRDTDQYSA